MSAPHAAGWSRRQFLRGVTLAGTAGLLSVRPVPVAAEPPPETTRLRVHHSYSLCLAPQYVAEALLRGEGFTEVHYVTHEESGGLNRALASGAADIANDFAPVLIMRIDAGDPIKPRHNFVYLSADVSRPYRFIVTPQICLCGLSPGRGLNRLLCGAVAGEVGLEQTRSS